MIGVIVKISVDTWLTTHDISEWTDAHNTQYEKIRKVFHADLPGFRGYEIGLEEIKIMFDTMTQANHLLDLINTHIPLINDFCTTKRVVTLNQKTHPYRLMLK